MWPPDNERFADRATAGRELGAEVMQHLTSVLAGEQAPALVLALPRGGVPVAVEVASALRADFDLLIACRIGLPWQPDFGIGAIAEDGPPVFDHDALASAGLSLGDVGPAVQRARAQLQTRQDRYRGGRTAPAIAGRTVVVVDDGLTPSVVARAAVRALRKAEPAHLVFAAPVCAAESADCLCADADAVVHVRSPREFHALGLWYRDFTPLGDDDVTDILTRARGAAPVR
ncbi:MAG TPA: phosphoribosyltransferase [Micromonosporaceae bacterium]|nr:phosphoribosyltransferase [Micromonosporaceae bacterium]